MRPKGGVHEAFGQEPRVLFYQLHRSSLCRALTTLKLLSKTVLVSSGLDLEADL